MLNTFMPYTLRLHSSPIFYRDNLQNFRCKHNYSIIVRNRVDPCYPACYTLSKIASLKIYINYTNICITFLFFIRFWWGLQSAWFNKGLRWDSLAPFNNENVLTSGNVLSILARPCYRQKQQAETPRPLLNYPFFEQLTKRSFSLCSCIMKSWWIKSKTF